MCLTGLFSPMKLRKWRVGLQGQPGSHACYGCSSGFGVTEGHCRFTDDREQLYRSSIASKCLVKLTQLPLSWLQSLEVELCVNPHPKWFPHWRYQEPIHLSLPIDPEHRKGKTATLLSVASQPETLQIKEATALTSPVSFVILESLTEAPAPHWETFPYSLFWQIYSRGLWDASGSLSHSTAGIGNAWISACINDNIVVKWAARNLLLLVSLLVGADKMCLIATVSL